MTELRRRMTEDLALAGYSPKTQRSYLDAVRKLAKHYMRSPDKLSEEEIRQFFLYLINRRKAAKSTVTIYLCGIKFFFEKTLGRLWPVFDLVRPRRSALEKTAGGTVAGGGAGGSKTDKASG